MSPPYRFSVATFVEHFRGQGEAIAQVQDHLHRKLLYCSALDPLARALHGRSGSQRNRLVDLLTNHTNWADARRVSLFQLACHLKEKKRTRYRLYREIKGMLDKTPPRRKLLLSNSPEVDALLPFAKPEEEKAVRLHTYANLFYSFRNRLVHEYREPGYGTDWSQRETEPFYTNMSAFGSRELVFPVAFVQRLFNEALAGLEAALLKQRINPHSRFTYGSYWPAE